jgi:hypothetical protein
MKKKHDSDDYVGNLSVDKVDFGFDYYPGKIQVPERRKVATVLNDALASNLSPGNKAIGISAHCHGKPKSFTIFEKHGYTNIHTSLDVATSFYRDDSDIVSLCHCLPLRPYIPPPFFFH